MSKYKLYTATVFLILVASKLFSQTDKHYTMFFGNALSVNPAAAGMFNGDGRAFSSYRSQWGSVSANPFKTLSFSLDGKIFDEQIENGVIGVGLTYFNDKAGDGKFTNSNFGLAANYAIEVQSDFYFSMGIQGGFGQYKINYDNFTWGNQWAGNDYNTEISSGEPFYNSVNSFFDLSAGIYFYGPISNYVDIKGGISGLHLLAQDVSLINATDKLYRNYSFTFFPEIRLPYKRIAFDPGIYAFVQGPNKELMLGTEIKYYIKESSHYTGYYDETSFTLGGFVRLGDAIVFTGAFNHAGISFGMSYDVNISSLKTASTGLGGYEFFLRYRLGFGYKYTVGGKSSF